MYIPFHNREPDRAKIIAFMRDYPFATLVTTRDGKLNATHLPVLIEQRERNATAPELPGQDEDLVITAHLARGNTQWMDFGSTEALVIFQEPHAFISTRHYERPLSVPTWNYVAVHAYGILQILPGLQDRLRVVEQTVLQFEGNLDQWDTLPNDFKQSKANGIVAFELQVTRLDARFKLSQDRTRVEQENIIRSLTARAENVEYEIAAMMQEKLDPVSERA